LQKREPVKIIDATVYEPKIPRFDEKLNELPPVPELNLLVEGINLGEPDFTMTGAGGSPWTVFEYGEHFINFADPYRREEEWDIGEFNTSGATEYAYFPVRVSENSIRMRSRGLYAPVPFVRLVLDQHTRTVDDLGRRWDIRVNSDAADRGRIEFELHRRDTVVDLTTTVKPHPPASEQVIEGEVI
jgi:hypothetical protein